MQRLIVVRIAAGTLIALGVGSSTSTQAAAPAPSSYFEVEKTISTVRDAWSRPVRRTPTRRAGMFSLTPC